MGRWSFLPLGLLLEVQGRVSLFQTLLDKCSWADGLGWGAAHPLPSPVAFWFVPTLTRFLCREQPVWAAASQTSLRPTFALVPTAHTWLFRRLLPHLAAAQPAQPAGPRLGSLGPSSALTSGAWLGPASPPSDTSGVVASAPVAPLFLREWGQQCPLLHSRSLRTSESDCI